MALARPARELGTRAPWLHEGGIEGLAIARDGNVLTYGPGDARRWMLATGEMAQRTERGPRGGGSRLQAFLLPDVERFITWVHLDDGTWAFRIWDLASGAFLGEVPRGAGFTDDTIWAIDRDGRRALVSTYSEAAAAPALVSVDDGSLISRLSIGYEHGAFLSTGEFVTSTGGGAIHLWDAEGRTSREIVAPREAPADSAEPGPMRVDWLVAATGTPVFAAQRSNELVVYEGSGAVRFAKTDHWTPVAFSHDGERVAISTSGHIVVCGRDGTELASFSTDATPVDVIALGRDVRMLIAASSSGEIHIRSTAGSKPSAKRRDTVFPGEIASIAGTPDAQALVIACASGDLLHWKLSDEAPTKLPGTGRSYATTWFLPDGTLAVAAGSTMRTQRIGEVGVRMEATFPTADLLRSPDGALAACVTTALRATLFDAASGNIRADHALETTSPPDNGILNFAQLALSSRGWIARIDKKDHLIVWNHEGRIAQRAAINEKGPMPYSGLSAIAFLSENELLFASHLAGTGILDVVTGAWSVLFPGEAAHVAAVDVPRRRVAFAKDLDETGDLGLVIWDVDAGARVKECPVDYYGGRFTFLSDGSLVTATIDRRVVVWERP